MLILNILTVKPQAAKTEVLAGLTVALALIPEAVAFALIAGVSPITGIQTAFVLCLITAFLGGRPGMISAATGAIVVVAVGLVVTHGVEYLFAAVILMGLIQIILGLLKLGKFIRLVPVSVVYGFVNGLAVVIFMSQLAQFQTVSDSGQTTWLTGSNLYLMLGLVALTVGVIVGLPKLTRAVPSTLVAIVVVSAIVIGFDIPTRSVSDIAQISGGLPQFHLPSVPLGMETLWVILPYSVIMAAVGLIESLLTLAVVDEMTETRGQGNRECLAQGAANIASGLTAGMGGCAMIGQSMINVSSGARHRLSGIVAAVALILFVQFGGELIGQIPMAALVGVMVMVSVGTFEWASLRTLRRMPWMDVAITAIVTLITAVFHNLAVAVLVGVILAALNFAWENAVRIRARKFEDHRGVKHYQIYGLLFFGSVTAFSEKFDPENDLQEVVIDFHESRLVDQSAIEAVHKVTERYAKQGKRITLKHLSSDSRLLLRNAHTLVQVNYWADPDYRVLSDSLEG